MTTDATADAIAALTKIIAANDRYVADTQPAEPDLLTDTINESRPVLQALLSAQGQAGKPVAKADATLLAEIADILKYPEQITYDSADALRESRNRILALLANLTTARTALEAAEKALGPIAGVAGTLGITEGRSVYLTITHRNCTAPADAASFWKVRQVLSKVSSALATIKGLET